MTTKLRPLLCRFFKHRIGSFHFAEGTEIRCVRCGELLSSLQAEPEIRLHLQNDPRYVSGCLGKVRFESSKLANERMDRMKVRPATLHAYACDYCGGFHLGNRRLKRRA